MLEVQQPKHMSQLQQEGSLSLDEAQRLLEQAEQVVSQASSGSGFAAAEATRKVEFYVDRIRVLGIDTGNWTFDAKFCVNLKWHHFIQGLQAHVWLYFPYLFGVKPLKWMT